MEDCSKYCSSYDTCEGCPNELSCKKELKEYEGGEM